MSSRAAFSCVASDAAVAAAEHLTALAFCDHTCKHESAAGPPHHFDQRLKPPLSTLNPAEAGGYGPAGAGRATPARAGGADGFGKKARLARAARRADGAAAEARRVAAVAAARRSAMAGWGD